MCVWPSRLGPALPLFPVSADQRYYSAAQGAGLGGPTCLLLRKQFWMTFMMKLAASRSLMLGLNLCLEWGVSGLPSRAAPLGYPPRHVTQLRPEKLPPERTRTGLDEGAIPNGPRGPSHCSGPGWGTRTLEEGGLGRTRCLASGASHHCLGPPISVTIGCK